VLVLALDTATPTVVVGIIEVGPPADSGWFTTGVRAARTASSGNRHAETLGQLIPEVLSESDLRMTDLSVVVVGLGPGPFTGLRVGVMTAVALGDALGLPVYGVCTHDAIAATYAGRAGTSGEAAAPGEAAALSEAAGFVVVTDARRRECYWAGYDASGARVSGPDVERPADMLTRPDWRSSGLVIGDPDFSEPLGTEMHPAEPDLIGLVLAASGLTEGQPPGALEPMYLRRPDAAPPAPRKPVTPR